MNHLCGCTGVSASSLDLSKRQEISYSCKICGGKPVVDGQGAFRAGMLSNISLEISGLIDPHLNWRTASKGKPRAVRRARTSFSNTRWRPLAKSMEKNIDTSNQQANKLKEMPVTESEKLGVTILGQRFSDAVESVPIKKRRFLFRSPSPPRRPHGSDHSSVTRTMPPKVGNIPPGSNGREHSVKINTKKQTDVADKSPADEMTNSDDPEDHFFDAADFSGISILAEAACNSSSVEDVMDAVNLGSLQASFKGDAVVKEIREPQIGLKNEVTKEETHDTVTTINDEINSSLGSTSQFFGRREDVTKMNGLSSEKDCSRSFSTSLKDNISSDKVESSRDGRFHWDLNTVMETWESPDDDVNSQHPALVHIHSWSVDKQEVSEKRIAEIQPDAVFTIMEKMDLCRQQSDNYKSENTVGSNLPNSGFGSCPEKDLVEETCLGCSPVQMTGDVKEMNVLNTEGYIKESHAPESVGNSPLENAYPPEVDNAYMDVLDFDSKVQTEGAKDFQPDRNGTSATPICMCEQDSIVNKTTSETVLCERTVTGGEVEPSKCSNDCGLTDLHVVETVQAVTTALQPDQGICILDGGGAQPISRWVLDTLPDGILCEVIENRKSEGDGGQSELCEEKSITVHQSTGRLIGHKDDLNGWMCAGEGKNVENTMLQDMVLCGQGGSGNGTGLDCDIKSKESVSVQMINVHLLVDEGNDKNNADNVNPVNTSDNHFDCDYYSDTSQNEHAFGMEKTEQRDDESQYEDGEFRESFVHSWEVDGCEEGEAEHLDYGSDNRDIDGCEAASDYLAPICHYDGSSECKNEGPQKDHHAIRDPNVDKLKTESSDFSSSVAGASYMENTTKISSIYINKVTNGIHSKRNYVSETWECSTREKTVPMTAGNAREEIDPGSKGDDARKGSHSTSLRMKPTGWDRLPGACRSFGGAAADSEVDTLDMKLDNISEKLGIFGSKMGRELKPQVGSPKSAGMLHGKSKDRHFGGNRIHDCSADSRDNVKRDIELSRYARTDDTSMHMHLGGRGGRWMESSSHQGSSHHGSLGYYGCSGYSHPSSKNAAAASIAKVESDGFVVAPDGTILDAVSVGHSSRLSRGSANSSPNTRRAIRRRGSSVERDGTLSFNGSHLDPGPRRDLSPARYVNVHGRPGRYGSKVVGEGNLERYHCLLPDDVGSSLSLNHSFSRRDRSLSPQTRPLQLSKPKTKSRSPSRAHSPHVWASPGRGSSISNGLRRRSRSPSDFRSEGRVGRMKSPHVRSGFLEHMASFPSSQRSHASPSPASRWTDERGDLEHFRDKGYRRFSEKSPPKKLFSRDHRCNSINSSGRLRSDDFYRPLTSSRFSGLNVGRRSSYHDGNGSRRHLDHYEMLHSANQYDVLGDGKQLRYETDDRFRLHNSHPKNASDFTETGSPRNFNSGVGSQLNKSPPRIKEGMSHFRYGRDGKRKTNYETFELQEYEEDKTSQRG